MARSLRRKSDLITALTEHLGILKDAILSVKEEDFKYTKIIASELRVLVYKSRSNKPLLSDLAVAYSITPIIVTDGPRGMRSRTLDEYLAEVYFVGKGGEIIISNKEFIGMTSQQDGGSHEDWKLDDDYIFSKGDGLLIGGLPPNIRKLVSLGEHIHGCGQDILAEISERTSPI